MAEEQNKEWVKVEVRSELFHCMAPSLTEFGERKLLSLLKISK